MEVIELSDASSDEEPLDRRGLLAPVVGRVVDALGGYEGSEYVIGDQANGCLKDLKKLWRKDETDDERTVARLFWEMRVLPNDLVAILLQTAGKGLVEDKRAINCVDLMTAMTWPIDLAEELKELDEELDKGTDYTQLLESHLHYKVALLQPGIIQALFGIMLAPLAKPAKERMERDGQVINVVLHLIRNLAFIKDLPSNRLNPDQAQFSTLQSKLIRALSDSHTFNLLLTIATNVDNDPLFNGWNTLVLEIFYLFFRGVQPSALAVDQTMQPTETLHRLLDIENSTRREFSRSANSRHSRFGTTICVKLNPKKSSVPVGENTGTAPPSSRSFILHQQQAISGESGSIMDLKKRHRAKKVHKVDEFGIVDNLSLEARVGLQNLATEFIQSCFNPFLSAILKDIRSERPKITEKDNLRLLFVTKWFLQFFQAMRLRPKETTEDRWNFGFIGDVTERSWIVWILKRMREAVEEKPKLWTELQAGVECLTQLLLLIDKMSSSDVADPHLREASDILQQQLVYSGEVLDIALDSLRQYKPGTQSLAYLSSSIHMAYALLRMLESWSKKGNDTYVRQKAAKKKRKSKAISEEEGIPDVEDIEDVDDNVINETLFTFEAFESKFAQSEITHTLLAYLARYREFSSADNMKWVVSLLHRQAVKAKAEGLFFQVSTLNLFKSILSNQGSLPREQPYKDLVNLLNFILRQIFKSVEKDAFLAIEVLFPKNRGHWKHFSSWEPGQPSKAAETIVDTRFPPDVEVKKGYSWSDQLGIVIAALIEANEKDFVKWTTEESRPSMPFSTRLILSQILSLVIGQRSRIIEEIDGTQSQEEDGQEESTVRRKITVPSAEAMAKITDYLIPYVTDEQADAATKNPQVKLLFRLSKFYILNEDDDELEWYIPAAILVEELQRTLNVINQFLQAPIDLDGKKASELLSKKRRRRRRRSPSPASDDDDATVSADEPRQNKRKEKKKREKEVYKSAQFIEDSDVEYGDMEGFLEKEKAARERAILAAEGTDRPATMKPTGTKKRRRNAANGTSKPKERPTKPPSDDDRDHDSEVDSGKNEAESLSKPRPRPKPRLRKKDDISIHSGSTSVVASESETHVDGGLDNAQAIEI